MLKTLTKLNALDKLVRFCNTNKQIYSYTSWTQSIQLVTEQAYNNLIYKVCELPVLIIRYLSY